MTPSNKLLSRMSTVLVFAFPMLILCVPRGAGIFLAGVGVLALLGWRGMGRAWREYADVLTPLAVAVLAFMVVYVGSKLYFHTPWDVIDNPSRTLLAILTCWAIVRAAPNSAWLWRGITVGLLLALLIVGVQKFALYEDRPSAWLQAIAFANMVAALALVGFARPGESRSAHAEAWINLLLASLILMLNGTRGAMVALLVTAVPMLLIRYRRFSVRMFVVAVAAVAGLSAGAYLMPDSPVSARVNQAVTEVQQYGQGNTETSVGMRLKIWSIGLQYFSEHPWTGVGVGQFARILLASEFCQTTESRACVLEHAHNDIVEAASTTGIPGVITMLGLFLVPAALFVRGMRASLTRWNPQGMSLGGAGLGVVMASLICGLTQVTMAHQADVVFYAGLVGMLLGLAGREAHSACGVDAGAAMNRMASVDSTRTLSVSGA